MKRVCYLYVQEEGQKIYNTFITGYPRFYSILPNYRIRELLRLEKTIKTIKSYHKKKTIKLLSTSAAELGNTWIIHIPRLTSVLSTLHFVHSQGLFYFLKSFQDMLFLHYGMRLIQGRFKLVIRKRFFAQWVVEQATQESGPSNSPDSALPVFAQCSQGHGATLGGILCRAWSWT